MLKHFQLTLLMVPFLVLSATSANAQPTETTREQITLRGTVETIDHTARTIRIRGDRGNVVTLDIPQSIVPFDQVQTGDVVSVAYFDRVSVRVKPEGEPPVDRTEPAVTTPTASTLPGATVATQRVTTVTITGWDPALRVVTFTGPTGTEYSRRVLDTTDAGIMTGLKTGQRVDVTRTEAVRLAVEQRTTVNVNATEEFRHRFTMLASWGWDNTFNGNMIQGLSGQTTTGVPINFTDTSYDDVYGKFDVFKLGGAFRTTPRTEAVLNFVWSKEGPEQGVIVGSAGTGAVPLHVNFDDYSYWGFEGGQRFYFTRVRVTPYLGYLVGLNRYGDIQGVFVDVPLNVTPGLATQEGKFFEKSWALSFGPTFGMLFGVGPFELMLETELKWMGGLSDVDWLVEEGLRDVNADSSRWSYPINLGARIRF